MTESRAVVKKAPLCQLPAAVSVLGRSSSITGAFFAAIVPEIVPSDLEVREALQILEMDPNDQRCAYCGDKSTEWEHLRPLIKDRKPTGYLTEIANLVPSCGKCNQSKGNHNWRTWMTGTARRSPKSRGIPDLDARVDRLERYERWREPRRINFEAAVAPELWQKHHQNWDEVLRLLRDSQALATEIRQVLDKKVREES